MRNSLGSFDKPQSLKLLRNFEPSVMSERRSGRCLYRAPDFHRCDRATMSRRQSLFFLAPL